MTFSVGTHKYSPSISANPTPLNQPPLNPNHLRRHPEVPGKLPRRGKPLGHSLFFVHQWPVGEILCFPLLRASNVMVALRWALLPLLTL